ncbi:hypothetical protein [Microbacterium sp. MM2322]|uniref:hypothetical protein n=1 Tax=Microbacterium sp. MM2322 TaxID=3157631 RepID=UPI0032D57318
MTTHSRHQGDDLVWSITEPDMHVCVTGARTVGFVVRVEGGFIAFDDDSNPLGRYQRLRTAKQSVETIPARRSIL